MKFLFSFLAVGSMVMLVSLARPAKADVRCDSLFSHQIADVNLFATHLSPGTNRLANPFRFEFAPNTFSIRVLGNYAESAEGARHFPAAIFKLRNPRQVSVNAKNRVVAVIGDETAVYSFADGITPNLQGWRRIDQARGRHGEDPIFLVYEVPLTTTRPNYGFFKIYVASGAVLREVGSVVPRMILGLWESKRVVYPIDAHIVRLISPTLVEIEMFDGRRQEFEIEPPTPDSEQGLHLRGFR